MKDLKELKEKIENIVVDYDYDRTYSDLYNTVIDYMNDTQDWFLEELFNDFVDYDTAEEIAKAELERGGLLRLYYFLGSANLNNSLFRINGYGNLTDVFKDDLEYLKEQIIEEIDRKIN